MKEEIQQATERFETMIQAHQFEWNVSIGVFVIGVFILAYLIKRENGLNIQETILASMGLKKITRTWTIAIVNVLVVAIPVAIIFFTFYP